MMRNMLIFIVLALVSASFCATAQERNLAVTIPPLYDLQADAKVAHARDLPVLLVFASETCPYCLLVEEEFIKPMIISGQYTDKVLIRHVMIDSYARIKDFGGQDIDADALARRYGVSLVPTLVIVDAGGEPLVPRLVGITTRDFYGWEVDNAIDASLAKLRRRVAGALSNR